MNAEYLCQDFFSLLSEVVGNTDLLDENLPFDQPVVEYSLLLAFFRKLAYLVDGFRQSNCQLKAQLEACYHS